MQGFIRFFSVLFAVLALATPSLADDSPAPAADAEVATQVGAAAPVATTMHVAMTLEKLTKFEVGPGTFNAEFYLSIRCDAEPCKPDFEITNGKISGKEKLKDDKLEKEWRIKAELDGHVDLSEFPFDTHVLYIGLVDKSDPFHVTYLVDQEHSAIDSDVKLAGWKIEPKFAVHVETHKLGEGQEISEAMMGVGISRPRVSAFFKSFVPVFFMIFVAGFTLLLKPKSAVGRLGAATGGLLSVVMFHLSATSSLPPMGYLTLLDKFMISTYFIYLVNIALSVAMVRFEEKKKEKLSELAYLVAAGAVPGLSLIVWVAVFMRIV